MNKFLEEQPYTINHLQLILSYPAIIVPSLSEEDIQTRIVEAIQIYLKEEMSLEILLNMADSIHLFMGMRENQDTEIINALTKIDELSVCMKNHYYDRGLIKVTLIEILDKLIKKN